MNTVQGRYPWHWLRSSIIKTNISPREALLTFDLYQYRWLFKVTSTFDLSFWIFYLEELKNCKQVLSQVQINQTIKRNALIFLNFGTCKNNSPFSPYNVLQCNTMCYRKWDVKV